MGGLHGFIPYEKLKGLLGGKTSKDFEVFNNSPLDRNLNSDTNENVRGAIKDERVYSQAI
jgi:hypothetical protein